MCDLCVCKRVRLCACETVCQCGKCVHVARLTIFLTNETSDSETGDRKRERERVLARGTSFKRHQMSANYKNVHMYLCILDGIQQS